MCTSNIDLPTGQLFAMVLTCQCWAVYQRKSCDFATYLN